MRSKILITIVVLAVIVGIGVGVGLLAGRGTGASHPVATDDSSSNVGNHTVAATPDTHPTPPQPPMEVKPIIPADQTPVIQSSNIAQISTNSNSDTNWEDKIDDIVGSDDADTNKVKQLFALFPKLPPDGQEEVVQHLSNLVDDEDYAPLGDLLKNSKLPEGVLDELLADVLNRPNNLKLPLLLDVASDPDHAKKDEAKDLLELYLGDDYGSDWNSWGQHLTNWMQQNPD
ncbi:MAG TPA: hypothetical protein VH597_11620 [Verrucomicrobiae bacterium]|jgi:hypothetical protein|nr:hypothetical protein [Verrucomicrobiae bacterium]